MHLYHTWKKILLPVLFLFLIFQLRCTAQSNRGNDTSYYVFFPESITGRFYSSQKYTSFGIKNEAGKGLHYLPNTTLNAGAGVTWHNFSLNLAYGFGFLNKNADKGKTKYLDLQSHFYQPKWATDLYGQLYKGYHLSLKGFATTDDNYYYRPDIKATLFGLSRYFIFNSDRFSYRAAFYQNEWQRKSAGTFLLGAEAYYGILKGDSALVPQAIDEDYPEKGINRINYFSIGPGAGYAYTLVILHHLFFTGSLTGNLNFSYTTEKTINKKSHRFSVNPVTLFRVAVGYNGRSWNISANYVANNLPFKGAHTGNRYSMQTGKYRFVLAKRFMPGKRLQKTLKPLDVLFKE